jgi:hypothetical protein
MRQLYEKSGSLAQFSDFAIDIQFQLRNGTRCRTALADASAETRHAYTHAAGLGQCAKSCATASLQM